MTATWLSASELCSREVTISIIILNCLEQSATGSERVILYIRYETPTLDHLTDRPHLSPHRCVAEYLLQNIDMIRDGSGKLRRDSLSRIPEIKLAHQTVDPRDLRSASAPQ